MVTECRSSRINVVVVSDFAGCGCGASSGPLKPHLGCGLERQKRKGRHTNLLEEDMGQLSFLQFIETEDVNGERSGVWGREVMFAQAEAQC